MTGPRLADGIAGELIGTLVLGVAGMAAHPVKFDLVVLDRGFEPLPQIDRSSPASCRRSSSRAPSSAAASG